MIADVFAHAAARKSIGGIARADARRLIEWRGRARAAARLDDPAFDFRSPSSPSVRIVGSSQCPPINQPGEDKQDCGEADADRRDHKNCQARLIDHHASLPRTLLPIRCKTTLDKNTIPTISMISVFERAEIVNP